MDTLILTGWGWNDYAVAAALALRHFQKADILGISTRRLPEFLNEVAGYKEIVIIGIGLTGNTELLAKALLKQKNKGVKVSWISCIPKLLGLAKNSVLLVMPLICAGIVMILKPTRARDYIEKEVDWWTLLFFMLLFAVAGTLEHTGVDKVMAEGFSRIAGSTPATLVPFIFTVSAFGSAFVDNVIFVAAFSPVIEQLSTTVADLPLWWALLFGACFGGNITMIGSTANIVALGMLEKHGGSQISFFQWFKIGLLCTALSGTIAIVALLILAPHMPDHKVTFQKLAANSKYIPATEVFSGELSGELSYENKQWFLKGSRGAKIRLIMQKDEQIGNGNKVSVSGEFSKDPSNKDYPYLLTVKKIKQLKDKE